LEIKLLDLTIFVSKCSKIAALRDSYRCDLDAFESFILLDINFRYGMICIAPHVRLNCIRVASNHVLPISFSELAECEVGDSTQLAVALIIPDAAFAQVLDREVHALKLVEEADISQGSVS